MRTITRADLAELDRTDPLAPMRERFTLPDGIIYLDGNSLGPLPRAAAARIAAVVEQEWGRGLIRSWNDAGWMDLPVHIADGIARLIGGAPGTVAVCDSTSVNLFKLLGAALRLRPGRRTILSETENFATDLYVAQGLARFLEEDHKVRTVNSNGIAAVIDDDTAVVMLTHVNYRTGAMHDMPAITAAAHAHGALMLWDLAHSAGAVPLDLAACDADFAIGCGYKYLNGGPGAPSFLYVAPRLLDTIQMPLTGWLGHAAPFAFEPSYRPASGIARATVGTPAVLSLAGLQVGVETALLAPIADVREKSVRLTGIFADLVAQECGDAFRLVTPRDPARCGSQICLFHPDGYAIMQALIARGVIGDFRAPGILRFGFAPLYIRYIDAWDAVATLRAIMETDAWRAPEFAVYRAVT